MIKASFILLRYLPIPAQFINLYFLHQSTSGNASRELCLAMYGYEGALVQALVTALEIIIAGRVYATFHESTIVAIVLAIIILAELIFNVVGTVLVATASLFNGYCIVINHVPGLGGYTAYAMVFAQALLGIVQAIGIIRLGTKFRRTDRLLFVLMRDHLVTFVFILTVIIIAVVFLKYVVYEVFYFLVPFIACFGCRIVLNMQDLALNREAMELTSVLPVGTGASRDTGFLRSEPNSETTPPQSA